MEYEESGLGGSAAKTMQGKKQAVACFNSFTSSMAVPLPPFENLTESQLCDISLFRKFGTYLIKHARDSNSLDLVMKDSALQYLSGVKTSAASKFPKSEMFKSGHDGWYGTLRTDIDTQISRRCLEEGKLHFNLWIC